MKKVKHILYIDKEDLTEDLELKNVSVLNSAVISIVILPHPLTRKDVADKKWVKAILSALEHPDVLMITNEEKIKGIPIYGI